MVGIAVLIGLAGGLGSVGFREFFFALRNLFWGTDAYSMSWIEQLPWYWVVGIPTIGALVVGVIGKLGGPQIVGHGVPEVMEAVAVKQSRIPPQIIATKALSAGICVASGGSVGHEGPIVQIGAAIGSLGAQIFRMSPRRARTLVGCGAAAGIAATFNAPVAGALFAVEVILGDFGVPQFSPIVISSVVATVVSHHFLGDEPVFAIPDYAMSNPLELLAYAVLGLVAAMLAVAFQRLLIASEDRLGAIKQPLPLKAAVGGLFVGCVALAFPNVLGVGYETIDSALRGELAIGMLVTLLVLKLVCTCVTLGSGGSGGILAPSLFLGAMAGGGVGATAGWLFPGAVGQTGAYALVGTGAVVAAATQAPLTAIVMLFELTGNYHIILPLMVSCFLGSLLAAKFSPESIYTAKLVRRGIRVRAGRDVNVLRNVGVTEVLQREVGVIRPSASLRETLDRVMCAPENCLYVVDDDGRYHGAIALRDLQPMLDDVDGLSGAIVALDVARMDLPWVHLTDGLDAALDRLALSYRDELPVLEEIPAEGESPARGGGRLRLVGAVSVGDVLRRYRRELFKHDLVAQVATPMSSAGDESVLVRVGDFVLAEVPAPQKFWGLTLRELDVGHRLGVNVLLVRPDDGDGEVSCADPTLASGDTVVRESDRLLVFGTWKSVERVR